MLIKQLFRCCSPSKRKARKLKIVNKVGWLLSLCVFHTYENLERPQNVRQLESLGKAPQKKKVKLAFFLCLSVGNRTFGHFLSISQLPCCITVQCQAIVSNFFSCWNIYEFDFSRFYLKSILQSLRPIFHAKIDMSKIANTERWGKMSRVFYTVHLDLPGIFIQVYLSIKNQH